MPVRLRWRQAMDPEKRRSDRRREFPVRLILPVALLFLLPGQLAWPAPAWALSEIGSDAPESPMGGDEGVNPEGGTLTLPGPAEESPGGNDAMRPDVEPDGPL